MHCQVMTVQRQIRSTSGSRRRAMRSPTRQMNWIVGPLTERQPMHLLYIESSPRGPRSVSSAVAQVFLQAYRQACPELTVDTLNVWKENLPDFDQEAIGAKYKGISKEPMDPAEAAVWEKIRELAARFRRTDRIVLGVPMWTAFLASTPCGQRVQGAFDESSNR